LLGVPAAAGARAALGPRPGTTPDIPGVGPDMLAPPPAQLEAPPPRLAPPAKQIAGPPAATEAPVAKPGEVLTTPPPPPTEKAIDKAVEPAKTETAPKARGRGGRARATVRLHG
jgi:hypothetical protein